MQRTSSFTRRKSVITADILEDPDYYVDIKDVTIGPLLGTGAFSFVYIGKYFGDLVAVKKQVRDAETIENYLLQELTVLKNLKDAHHENLVAYIGACNEILTGEHPYTLYIITEYCQGGDLLPLLLKKDVPLGWKFRIKLAYQAACAIYYLHDNNFIHRDIKSSNCLLDSNWTLKLTDFGLSRTVSDPFSLSRMTICGTHEYMAPEMLFQEDYSCSVDIFCLGFVFLELIMRKKAGSEGFLERKPQTNFEVNVDELLAQLPKDAPSSLVLLTQQCIQYDSTLRPIALEVQDWLEDLHKSFVDEVEVPLPKMQDIPENFGHEEVTMKSPMKEDSSRNLGGSHKNNASTPTTPVPISPSPNTQNIIRKQPNATTTPTAPMGTPLDSHKSPVRPLSVAFEKDNLIRRSGMLSKRNATGLRNWKKQFFTLHRTKLSWVSSNNNTNNNNTEKTKFMSLRGATVQKGRALRFQILTVEADHAVLNKELAADSQQSLDAWVRDIQDAIVAANQEAAYETEKQAIIKEAEQTTGTLGALRIFNDVTEWLHALDLVQYLPLFQQHHYTYAMICDMGLSEADCDFLGIVNPLHRAILIAGTKPAYSENIRIAITGHRQFDSVTVYTVVSRFHFFRSSLCLRYTDFKKFDTIIRRTLKAKSAISNTSIPALPSQGQGILGLEIKDPITLAARQAALEAYLNVVAGVLQDTPHVRSLLEFLDLTSS